MKYKYIGTEEQLIENGFNVMSKSHPYKNGGYPLIWRARRHDIVIYLGTGNKEDIIDDKGTLFAYSGFENQPKNTHFVKNLIYSQWEQKELSNKYPILDLIEQDLVKEVEEND